MAILCDKDMKALLSSDHPIVYVTDGNQGIDIDTQLGPSSLDLRLDTHFAVFRKPHISVLDTKSPEIANIIEDIQVTKEEGIIIHPGEFVLGTTLEHVRVPNDMVARLEGRSSYARLGIAVHSTAGFIDPGFEGQVTLEIQNLGNIPVRLYPGERVCQIVFETMTGEAETPYHKKHDNKYMNQKGATFSKLHMEKR